MDNAIFETVGRHHEKVHFYARRIVDLYHQGEQAIRAAMMNDFKSAEKSV